MEKELSGIKSQSIVHKKENKKVRNATVTRDKGITFKSQLEKSIYNTLVEKGFDVKYECTTFVLWDGFKPVTPFYDKESDSQQAKRDSSSAKILVLKNEKVIGIRYTPDFYFRYKDWDIWIEAKGMENDVFYVKKKLFRKYLDDKLEATGQKSIFFEVYTKKHLLQALNIVKEYGDTNTENSGPNQVSPK